MFESIPVVGGECGLFAFRFKPGVERILVDGEEQVRGGMGDGGR